MASEHDKISIISVKTVKFKLFIDSVKCTQHITYNVMSTIAANKGQWLKTMGIYY